MEVPSYSTLKAFLLPQLLAPIARWTAHGTARIEAGLGGRGRRLLVAAALGHLTLVYRRFVWPPG